MVRHHVAQRAGRIVIAAAASDGERFRDRDLHVVDVIAIPDRLEQSVGEAQHQDVLHRLLAEIMVDAENLILLENAEKLLIERPRGSEIGAERLLDDDAPPGAVVLPRQAGLAEMAADRREARRRRCQIEQPIALGAALALDAGKLLPKLLVSRLVVGIALDIGDAAEHLLDHALDRLSAWRISAGSWRDRREMLRSMTRCARRRSGRTLPAAARRRRDCRARARAAGG